MKALFLLVVLLLSTTSCKAGNAKEKDLPMEKRRCTLIKDHSHHDRGDCLVFNDDYKSNSLIFVRFGDTTYKIVDQYSEPKFYINGRYTTIGGSTIESVVDACRLFISTSPHPKELGRPRPEDFQSGLCVSQ